jgi:large subunit ribosomal protein L9
VKIILLKDVEHLGKAGQIVEVAPGHARNLLIPQRQALVATAANVAQFESRRRQHEAVAERERRAAEALAQKLESDSLTAPVHVGEDDRLFGSVTAQNVLELLAAKGYEVDRKVVQLEEPIRALGVYSIDLRLHPEVTAQIKLWVVKE